MVFGQRGNDNGNRRLEYVPQGLPNRNEIENLSKRQSASAAQLNRTALGAFAIAVVLVLAPFTVIPAIKSYALNDADAARIDQPVKGENALRSAEVHYGPAFVKRKLGFASAADGRCAKLWPSADSVKFREAMICYAASNASRLCDSREKEWFLALSEEYFRAENDLAFAHAVNSTLMEGQLLHQRPQKSGADVMNAYRSLAMKGYIAIGDFGWQAPGALRNALNGATAARSPC